MIEIGLVAEQLVEQHAQEAGLKRGLPAVAPTGAHQGCCQQRGLIDRAVDQKHGRNGGIGVSVWPVAKIGAS